MLRSVRMTSGSIDKSEEQQYCVQTFFLKAQCPHLYAKCKVCPIYAEKKNDDNLAHNTKRPALHCSGHAPLTSVSSIFCCCLDSMDA